MTKEKNKFIGLLACRIECNRLKNLERKNIIREPRILDIYKIGDELHVESSAILSKPIKFIRVTFKVNKNF